MRSETSEQNRALRFGYTTGACATATSVAAAELLLGGASADFAEIHLPRGERVRFVLEFCTRTNSGARAGTIKDAGDDPDVTHGALVFSHVTLVDRPGVSFHAGDGVGTVTREGLSLAVGEPAINSTPRRMISEHLAECARSHGYLGGFAVSVGVEKGAELAKRTMNGRLGIVGGLSILGTTGIVRPFSCAAYIASIHQGIDVARANGIEHIAACTGSSSERAARDVYALPDMALLEMGDFVGAVLKYLRRAPVPRLTLAGGFGKLSKLAAGHMDLHSRKSSIDFSMLAVQVAELGGGLQLQEVIRAANTSQQALMLASHAGLLLGNRICALARDVAVSRVGEGVLIDVLATNREGIVVGRAGVPTGIDQAR